MPTSNSSSLVKQTNLPVTLTRSSLRKNYIFLPILNAVNELILESIEDDDEDYEETEEEENERYFSNVPGATEGVEDDGAGEEEEEDEEDEDEDDYVSTAPLYRLEGHKMGFREFALLTDKLPHGVQGFITRYELINGELYVKTCPSAPHERAAEAFRTNLMRWQTDPADPTEDGDTLQGEGSAGKPPALFRTSY
jgi:hypothetical protein